MYLWQSACRVAQPFLKLFWHILTNTGWFFFIFRQLTCPALTCPRPIKTASRWGCAEPWVAWCTLLAWPWHSTSSTMCTCWSLGLMPWTSEFDSMCLAPLTWHRGWRCSWEPDMKGLDEGERSRHHWCCVSPPWCSASRLQCNLQKRFSQHWCTQTLTKRHGVPGMQGQEQSSLKKDL